MGDSRRPKDKFHRIIGGSRMQILQIKNVTRYFKGLTALFDISAEVEEGEILGIIGPNGAGKTTLFNVVSGFLAPSRGDIVFKDESLKGLRPSDIVRKGVVRSFQGTSLFPMFSCLGNMIVANHLYREFGFWQTMFNTRKYRVREEEVSRKSLRVLETLHLSVKRDVSAHDIPYGFQKALGIAMALATNAPLLLLDEPVAGMTPAESDAMAGEIRRIRDQEGKTIVLVEHNMRFVMRISDRITVLDFGRKIAEGSPGDCRSNPRVIECYLGGKMGSCA